MHASAFAFLLFLRARYLFLLIVTACSLSPWPTGHSLEEQEEERRTAFIWAEDETCTAYSPPVLFTRRREEEEKSKSF
jgi:hypothetical protein